MPARAYRRQAVSLATASSGPLSSTWAAVTRPIDHRVSSAGVPVTVTDGAAFLAMIGARSRPRGRTRPRSARAQEQPGSLQPLPERVRSPAGSSRSVQPWPPAARPRGGRSTRRCWPSSTPGSRTATVAAARPEQLDQPGRICPGTGAAPARCSRGGRRSSRPPRRGGVPGAPRAPRGPWSASPRRAWARPGRSRREGREREALIPRVGHGEIVGCRAQQPMRR